MPEDIHLFGIEIEFPKVHNLDYQLREFAYTREDDGSIREPTYSIGKIPVCLGQEDANNIATITQGMLPNRKGAIGLEYAFAPMDKQSTKKLAKKIANLTSSMPLDHRAGIHIHKGVEDKNFAYIRKVVEIFTYLEAIFFNMSAGNQRHRGEDPRVMYKYYRPLSSPIMYTELRRTPIGEEVSQKKRLISPHLLKAESFSELLAYWGRLDTYWDHLEEFSKWIPHRLSCVNILPLQKYGTIEYRLFNASYQYVYEFVCMVDFIHKLAEQDVNIYSLFPEPIILGTQPTEREIQEFIRLVEGDSENREGLLKLLNLDQFPLFDGSDLYHHYREINPYELVSSSREETAQHKRALPGINSNIVHNNLGEPDDLTENFVPYEL